MALLTSFAVCLFGILISSSFLGAKAEQCDRDWMKDQGNCYALFVEPATWAEAEIQCQSYGQGAHLASILKSSETELVSRYISNYPSVKGNVWIGLYDLRQNRKWRWSDGSVYNYKAWMTNQPDNAGNAEYCVELTPSTQFRQWNDRSCNANNAYLCKYEM